jgi:hypothetical protein
MAQRQKIVQGFSSFGFIISLYDRPFEMTAPIKDFIDQTQKGFGYFRNITRCLNNIAGWRALDLEWHKSKVHPNLKHEDEFIYIEECIKLGRFNSNVMDFLTDLYQVFKTFGDYLSTYKSGSTMHFPESIAHMFEVAGCLDYSDMRGKSFFSCRNMDKKEHYEWTSV